MGRKKIIRLNGDNYSELLYNFSNLFRKDFPDDYNIWEILDFSMEAWNIANLKKIVTEDQFKVATNMAEEFGETNQLFQKMLDYKVKHYGDFDRFIVDYNFDLEEEPPELKVTTGNMEAYKKLIEQNEIDEQELEENIVNRNAIILVPKKTFVDWVKKVDEDEDDMAFILETKIYLVDIEIGPEEWLEENYYDLFVRELEAWTLDEDLWPQNLSFTMFKKCFKVDFSIRVFDMENEEISKGIV